MTSEPADRPRRRRGRGWGIAATILAGIGILPVAVVVVLGYTVDPLWGWMLFIALPVSIAAGALGGVLGIIGIVAARNDGGGYAWPIVGLVPGAAQVFLATGWLQGWFI
ncbi:hypothetical protein [Microbacterium arborescens]